MRARAAASTSVDGSVLPLLVMASESDQPVHAMARGANAVQGRGAARGIQHPRPHGVRASLPIETCTQTAPRTMSTPRSVAGRNNGAPRVFAWSKASSLCRSPVRVATGLE